MSQQPLDDTVEFEPFAYDPEVEEIDVEIYEGEPNVDRAQADVDGNQDDGSDPEVQMPEEDEDA